MRSIDFMKNSFISCGLSLVLSASSAFAQTAPAGGPLAVLFVGTNATISETDQAGQPMSVYEVADLPEAGSAEAMVTATLLRNRAVSRIDATGEGGIVARSAAGQFFVIADLILEENAATTDGAPAPVTVSLGDKTISGADLGAQLNAVVSAFAPENRSIGFARINDPQSAFTRNMGALQSVFDKSGFGM